MGKVSYPMSSDLNVSMVLLVFVQKCNNVVLLWENNHLQGGVMLFFTAGHFPVIACPRVFAFLSKQLPVLTIFYSFKNAKLH